MKLPFRGALPRSPIGIATGAIVLLVLALGTLWVVRSVASQSAADNARIDVVFKSTDPSIEFWQIVKAGVLEAAKEDGAHVTVMGPKEEKDVAGQIAMLDRVLARRPQAVVLAADDYHALVPIARKLRNEGVKLVTIDSGLDGNVSQSFIATDNVAAGKKAGAYLAQILKPDAKIAVLSYVPGTLTAIDRERGVREQLGVEPGDEIIGTWYCEDLLDEAYSITKRLLTSGRHIDGIAALNEVATEGAAHAIADLGLGDQVQLVGFDGSPTEVKYLEAGVIKGLVLQKPFNMGYLGVQTAAALVRGERVSPQIDTGSLVVTRENMYDAESQKLLFPLVGGSE